MIEVRLLTPEYEEAYETFVLSMRDSLIYASLKYRDFLRTVLPNGEPRYLIAVEKGAVIGVLPAFLATSQKYGKILNSLPFYGSHGGLLVNSRVDAHEIKRSLLVSLSNLEISEDVSSSTIIASPFSEDRELYVSLFSPTHQDVRIGQISVLPDGPDDLRLPDQLMDGFHQKTRNAVRKGNKAGFTVRRSNSDDDFSWLQAVHAQNMAIAGGFPKSSQIFDQIRKHFSAEDEYCLFIAELSSERVAGLLMLYFNKRAEYYTPVIIERFRSEQALSFLIFYAMQDAVQRGCREWNWGGTATHQKDLYRFKNRWGSFDHPYNYYVRVRDQNLMMIEPRLLSAEFPFFYLFPFKS